MYRYSKPFSPIEFINDSKGWEAQLEHLKNKLEGITEIKGIDNSPIRSGRLHDSVADVAAEREGIEEQIERIKRYINIWRYIYSNLTDIEKEVLDVYFTGGRIDKKIYDFERKYAMCRSDVYALRRETLKKMEELVKDKIEVEITINYKF